MARRLLRLVALLLLAGPGTGRVMASSAPAPPLPPRGGRGFPAVREAAADAGAHHAGLVVDFGGGTVITRCVAFDEATISGYELLQRSGLALEVAVSGPGAAICSIEGTGCPASDCFCHFPPDYWSYWHLEGESWSYSQVGAEGYAVEDGAVDGWLWGDASEPPPVIPFEAICTTPTATPTATATPTSTPTATPTAPPPTATSTPTVPPPTSTPLPPTATATPLPQTSTPTATPLPPTATPTATPLPPTATATPTPTSSPTPTATPTATSTPTALPAATLRPSATPTPTVPPMPSSSSPMADDDLRTAGWFFGGALLVALLVALLKRR